LRNTFTTFVHVLCFQQSEHILPHIPQIFYKLPQNTSLTNYKNIISTHGKINRNKLLRKCF